jgi:(2Fe-2S) ferredoxin
MNSFETIRNQANDKWGALVNNDEPVIYLGTASCGRAAGALQVLETIQQTLQDLQVRARVVQVGCIGPCYLEPLMDIALPGTPRVSYAKMTPHKAANILKSVLLHGNLMPTMAVGHFGDNAFTEETGISRFFDLPMLKSQVRIILRNCGMIDAEDIDHYLANDGYLGFQKALETGPDGVIAELKASGLRGRGGAGYPAFQKWELCRTNKRHPKFAI